MTGMDEGGGATNIMSDLAGDRPFRITVVENTEEEEGESVRGATV